MKNKETYVFLVVMGIMFVFSLVISIRSEVPYATNSPDSLHLTFFSKQFSNGDGILYCLDDDKYKADIILGSRGMVHVKNSPECVSHGYTHGFIVLVGILRLIDDRLLYLINPLIGTITMIFFYFICRQLNPKNALISIVLSVISGMIIFYSSTLFTNIPELLFIVAAIYCITKISHEMKYPLMWIFLGIATWMRYTAIIYVVAFLIIALLKEKQNRKKVYFPFVCYIIILGLLLLSNFLVYGDLMGSYTPYGEEASRTIASGYYFYEDRPSSMLPFIPFYSIGTFFENLLLYVIGKYMFIFVIAIIGIVYSLLKRTSDKINISLLLLLMSINYGSFVGGIYTGYGSDFFTVGTSYVRYTLLAWLIIIFFGSMIFEKIVIGMKIEVLITFLVIMCILMTNLSSVIFPKYGVLDTIETHKQFIVDKQNLLSLIPEEAIVFTVLHDKYLFPERLTAIYSTYDEKTRVNLTIFYIQTLKSGNNSVFFIDDGTPNRYDIFSAMDYFRELNKNNISVKKVNDIVYEIG
jgi:hypothetical protein